MSDPITGKFVVLNGTLNHITQVIATHLCAGHTDSLEADSLAPGETSTAIDLNAKTSHDDHWSVTFSVNNSNVTGKVKCDYKQKDGGQVTVIALFDDSFSILKPESDPCRNVAYSSTSAAAGG
ncbi:MAG TPA: hypothetical protein VGW76_21860 [Pyrinomonadaceae bacterium]|nr:hypothetical protein [Pyrinomonadaceae bacterium]